ncbi:hypothetical protein Tco_1079445 [Tanacetum coccineum]|uniref:Retrotransposon gag domain-containing protein n=1 Tax=Tanacetum coccineum TaxID=301880 RepID=A0ABQ5HTD6_9ASTR
MAKPNLNEYISANRKNYLLDNNKGRMVEKSFLKIQGTFLVKIRDNAFNGTIGENTVEHIENFLKVVGTLKIKGVSHDRFRLSVFPISLTGATSEWFKKDCIGTVTTWEDLDHKWYDELADGVLKEEALIYKARFEESWGDATPRVMKFYAWLKNSFENFHELDHDVFVKLEECWWKVNTHEYAPFTRWENHGRGAYANTKLKNTYDPYLDINRIFGRNYGANNAGDTQDSQEHKKEHKGKKHTLSSKPTQDPSVCHVRRFKMIKYSFDVDDEYVAIKEHECFDHSRTNIDACQAYRELFCIMDEGWLVKKAKEE